jgi:8-oxo-dGTP diphosphatase
MSYRAAIVLLQDDRIALIERQRLGFHYFTFPGGHVEPGELPEQAAIREAREELGLDVSIQRLLAEIWWHDRPQYYYLAEIVGGLFGTGTGEEMHNALPERGTYHPVWSPVAGLPALTVFPHALAEMIVKARSAGWPDPAPVLHTED